MLRESAIASGRSVDIRAITNPSIPSLLEGGAELMELTTAAVRRDSVRTGRARAAVLTKLGPEALVDAAGTIGNFEMMNRVANATGMPVGKGSTRSNADIIEALDIARMEH